MLIRTNQKFHFGVTEQGLYDATRSAWKVGHQRDQVELAFAVFEGVIREVYRVTGWHPAGTTYNTTIKGPMKHRTGRWEFVGVVAEPAIRRRYLNRYVGDNFPQGAQNPIRYLNLPDTPKKRRSRRPG